MNMRLSRFNVQSDSWFAYFFAFWLIKFYLLGVYAYFRACFEGASCFHPRTYETHSSLLSAP